MRNILYILLAVGLPLPASAHSFGVVYTLPVPFWLYAWASAATLVLSFIVVGLFATRTPPAHAPVSADFRHALPPALVVLLQALSLLALVMCVLTGLFGTRNPYGNLNMTFFWIVFVLGYAYLTALIGDLYALINPWRTLARGVGLLWRGFERGRFRYPARAAYWPAVLLYGLFIWVELFGGSAPAHLAHVLLIYTGINLLGVLLFGSRDWFEHGELFAVFLRLIGRMAPVEFAHESGGEPSARFRLRRPLSGLLAGEARHASLLVFILFMLAATAYDGLHETRTWFDWFWTQIYPAFLTPWVGSNPLAAYPLLAQWYGGWQLAWLWLSPLVYLLAYLLGILGVWMAGGGAPLRVLALRYAYSLLPIVLVYHVTHYYTLLQTQGIKFFSLISDPFGRGQDWFGTARWFLRANIPDVAVVWHVQVVLIVLGHIASVYIAHLEALRLCGNPRRAALSQLPMLALMVLFTVGGLWILSQPMKAGG